MKINNTQLNNYLLSWPKHIVAALVFGPDYGLISLTITKLKQAFLGKEYNRNDIIHMEGDLLKKNPARLMEEAFEINLLGSTNKVIHVQEAGNTLNSLFSEYLASPDTNTLVILEGEDFLPNNPLRKLFEVEQNALAIPCYHDNIETITATVNNLLTTTNGFTVTKEALNWLVNNLGNDRLITIRELEKLTLYKGQNTEITLNDVIAVIDNNNDLAITKLVFDTFSGNYLVAHKLLEQMQEETPGIAIVRSFISHLKRLLQVVILMDKGIPASTAMANLTPPVMFMYADAFRRQLALWNLNSLNSTLNALNELELAIKSNLNLSSTLLGNFMLKVAIQLKK